MTGIIVYALARIIDVNHNSLTGTYHSVAIYSSFIKLLSSSRRVYVYLESFYTHLACFIRKRYPTGVETRSILTEIKSHDGSNQV